MAQRGLGPQPGPRNPRIVSWGELLWDIFPEGAFLGGSAANVAYHAALLGAESWLVSAVGRDPLGETATKRLADAGVETRGVGLDPRAKTGRVLVTMEQGQPQYRIEKDVAWDRIDPSPEAVRAILGADCLCFSTLAQRTPLVRTRLRAILRHIHDQGRAVAFGGAAGRRPLCVLDLNLRPPFADPGEVLEALSLADVVKLNENEEAWLAELLSTPDPTRWILSRFPARLVAVTRAEDGASLYTHHLTLHECGIVQHGGDPVGAGDAFVAALSVALARGESLPRCLEEANRLGAWVAGQAGAMPPHR